MLKFLPASVFTAISFLSTPALANSAGANNEEQPLQWGLGFQTPASPVAEEMISFHNTILLPMMIGISLFVLGLLIYVAVRFNSKANKEPSTTTHNVPLEIAWTVIPVVILIIIAIPSFKLLYFTERIADPDMTLKVTGYQWYWGYEYPDMEIGEFQSYMIQDDNIDPTTGQTRLVSTDYPVILPVDTDIQILVTSADVLHSFAMPAFGIKKDAVPGRLNETWVRIQEPGTYYGQCSELCGSGHAYMPIEIRAVSKDRFEQWREAATEDLDASYEMFADNDPPSAIFNIDEEQETTPDPIADDQGT